MSRKYSSFMRFYEHFSIYFFLYPNRFIFIGSLFYQNSVEKLFLKRNLGIYFVIVRNFNIVPDVSILITGQHYPLCLIIIISVINSNHPARKFRYRRVFPVGLLSIVNTSHCSVIFSP